MKPFRIFVSSPSDAKSAREIAALTIERLTQDYARFIKIEPYLWEFEVMIASGHFQDSIEPPSSFDVVLLILWSRLGTLLPPKTAVREYRGIDGRTPVTGTEWEFEEALQAALHRGAPDLLVYRSLAPASVDIRDLQQREEQLRQLESLERFWSRYFVNQGIFVGAYTTFVTNAEFAAALESNLRKLIERRIDALAASQGVLTAPLWAQAPFRGLEAYDFEHSPIFFGQDEALGKAMLQLIANAENGSPFLLLLGASGSGKSSLVKAGIVPKLFVPRRVPGTAFLRRVLFRPSDARDGEDLFDAFARRLTTPVGDREGLAELIGPGLSAEALAAHLRHATASPAYPLATALGQLTVEARRSGRMLESERAKLLLVIDQLEELFTSDSVLAAERIRFIELLHALVKSGLVWVVATMRKDFWHRADETPDLARLAEGAGRLELLPPTPAQLSQIIRRPAEAAGVHYEIDGTTNVPLNEVISEEVAREPGALPLLSYLLDQLYRCDVLQTRGNTLSYGTYQSLGRLEGAIATQAEAVMQSCPAEDRAALGSVLFFLIQMGKADGNIERAVARRVPLSTFLPGTAQRRLVEALLNPHARLLVTDTEKGGYPTIRVAHEALISHWGQARDFVQANAEALKVRHRIEERHALWSGIGDHPIGGEQGEKRSWLSRFGREHGLLSDIDLADGRRLLKEHRNETEPHLVDYIERSVADDRRARLRTSRILGTVIAVVTLLAVVATFAGFIASRKQHEAEDQAIETMKSQSRLLTEAAAQRLRQHDVPNAQDIILEVLTNPGFAAGDSPRAISTFQEARAEDRQVGVFWGHGDAVANASYSPDGTRVVTASVDKTARVWDALTGVQLKVLTGHTDFVTTAKYSPDGTRILTASRDKTARIWDARSGAQLAVIRGHEKPIAGAAYSPDGRYFVTASSDNTARIWDALTAAQLQVLTGHESSVTAAAYSADGSKIVTSSADKTARVWDAKTGHQIAKLTGHTDVVLIAAFSPDGARVVTGSRDKSARVWDTKNGKQIAILAGHREDVAGAAFSPDGTQIATASFDQTLRLWDAHSFQEMLILTGHADALLSAVYSPDGERIITTSFDKTARLWKSRGARANVLAGHEDALFFASYSPDGTHVVTASNDHTARIWEVGTGNLTAILVGHDNRVCSAMYSWDGARIVTSGLDGTARIWDPSTGHSLLVLHHNKNVLFAAFSPDSQRIVTASDDKVARVWDAVKGTQLLELQGHEDSLHSAVYSPDGHRIITTSFDKTARVWDSQTGKQLMVLSGHSDAVLYAAYSHDGTRIVTGSNDMTARTWDAVTGVQLAELIGHLDAVGGADFSPDDSYIATASDDTTARVWDSHTAVQLAVMDRHDGGVNSAAFSPDGRYVVTAANDSTALIWSADIPAPVPSQIQWQLSAQFEQMPDTQRLRYGLPVDPLVRTWPRHNTPCDVNAAAIYDPNRVTPGVLPSSTAADVANSDCADENSNPHASPRSHYEFGRALLMKNDFQGARKQFESALSEKYPAAQIDLADLLANPSAGMLDTARAATLYEGAWREHVSIAAFRLGQLYESRDAARALSWYVKGAETGEPYALAYLADREEKQALSLADTTSRNQMLLHALSRYATAAQTAHDQDWPLDAWKAWRYRRATLARELKEQGMMQQVADTTAAVFSQRGRPAATALNRVKTLFK